jgi:hypothetical protein
VISRMVPIGVATVFIGEGVDDDGAQALDTVRYLEPEGKS